MGFILWKNHLNAMPSAVCDIVPGASLLPIKKAETRAHIGVLKYIFYSYE